MGAAIATTIGRSLGVAYQLRALATAGRHLRMGRRHLVFEGDVALLLLRLSVGGIGQFLIATARWIGLVRILTPFGAAALAGYTIALRIIIAGLYNVAFLVSVMVVFQLGAEPGRGRWCDEGVMGSGRRPDAGVR